MFKRIKGIKMKKLKCWKKTSDEFGPSYKNGKGAVLDVLVTYPRTPVTVYFTKKDSSKVWDGIQHGTKTLFKGTKTKALSFAEKYMEEHNKC